MTILIGSNIASMQAQRALGQSTAELQTIYQQLASGLRINKASDDAAGLAVSESLNADRRVHTQGVRNLGDGISLLNIAESTTRELTAIVTRIEELATQAANGILGSAQRKSLDDEAQALAKEYLRLSQSTEFNNRKLYDGDLGELRLQCGYGTDGSIASSLGGVMGNGSVGAATQYLTESAYSFSTVLGDLNADGVLDLITAGRSDGDDGYATVRLGQGDGSFGTARSYLQEEYYSIDLSLGDLNNDGVLDLITTGENSSGSVYATVRLGQGDGSFGAASSYQIGSLLWAHSMALGDLNGDGFLDLVASSETILTEDGYATICLGRGDGSFGTALSYQMESYASYAVALGDLNNDRVLDLITAGYSDGGAGYATIRLGLGNGTFGSALSYLTESNTSEAVTLGDLNGDGVLDLVTAGSMDGLDGYATIRLGLGNGTFGVALSYQTESRTSETVTLGDLNGDGVLDLVTAGMSDSFDGYATIRLGLGNGTFGSALSYQTEGRLSSSVTLGDINADGVLDLVTAGNSDSADGYATIRLGSTRSGVAPLLPFSLCTQSDAKWAMSLMGQKLSQLGLQNATIGTFQSRLQTAMGTLGATIENYASAAGRITDADIAEESARLVRHQILQQAASLVIAQANEQPALALQLVQNGWAG